jgi:uncharacterized membrane protein YdjX (TVP38/TMEM64 family)
MAEAGGGQHVRNHGNTTSCTLWRIYAVKRGKAVVEKSLKQKLTNFILVAVVLVLFGAVATLYLAQCEAGRCPSPEAFVRSFGPWAPIIYAVVYIASSPVPFLAPALSAAGGLLFGTILGTVYTVVIATVSALVPFTMARRLGREWVESKLKGKKLEAIYEQSAGDRGFVFVLLMRLIPILPWEVQNYVGGLCKVSVLKFILATMLGIIAGTFSLVFLGSSIGDPSAWQFWAVIALKIVTALIPVVAVYLQNRRQKQAVQEQAIAESRNRG